MKTITEQLIEHEGLRQFPYLDCCGKPWRDCSCTKKGKLSIAVGRNLDDVGITENEARYLLENDLGRIRLELDQLLPWWRDLDPVRQMVLQDMGFNLGLNGLLGFKLFLGYLKAGEYLEAADEMLQSQWADQVGTRATRLAAMMRTATVEV